MGKATALITGASRGIGRGIALELAAHGYDIAGVATKYEPDDRSKGLREVQLQVEDLGMKFQPIVADISELDGHGRIIEEALALSGSLDILVNNAGVAPLKRLDILETTPESLDRLVSINLRGPFFLTQQASRQMLKQIASGTGYAPRIIFITSISSDTASPNRAEYCVSKAGLSMAAQNFAVRLAPEGINVYDIRPGIIETDMTSGVRGKYDGLIRDGLLLQPRWGTPKDVGRMCVAIAEGYLDYATGSVIEVGGGFGVRRL